MIFGSDFGRRSKKRQGRRVNGDQTFRSFKRMTESAEGSGGPRVRLGSLIGDDPTHGDLDRMGKRTGARFRVRTTHGVDAVKIPLVAQHRPQIYCRRANNGAIDFGEQITESSRNLPPTLGTRQRRRPNADAASNFWWLRESNCAVLRCRQMRNEGFNLFCIDADRTQDRPDRIFAVPPRQPPLAESAQ
jgi:hypothetical protein